MDIVQYLLQSGADVNLKTYKGESVADVASNQQVLKLLQQSVCVCVCVCVRVCVCVCASAMFVNAIQEC